MQVKIVYGAPCSGKSTYVKKKAGNNDLIYDYDEVLKASSNRKLHLTAKHGVHKIISALRYEYIKLAKLYNVETLWIICLFVEPLKRRLKHENVQLIKMDATEEECIKRLEADDRRTDKENWKELIKSYYKWYKGE